MGDLKASNGVSYMGALTSIFSGMTLSDWGILVGIVTGVLTFGITRYYGYQEHKARMAIYERGLLPNEELEL
jgi:hypothetical protein